MLTGLRQTCCLVSKTCTEQIESSICCFGAQPTPTLTGSRLTKRHQEHDEESPLRCEVTPSTKPRTVGAGSSRLSWAGCCGGMGREHNGNLEML